MRLRDYLVVASLVLLGLTVTFTQVAELWRANAELWHANTALAARLDGLAQQVAHGPGAHRPATQEEKDRPFEDWQKFGVQPRRKGAGTTIKEK